MRIRSKALQLRLEYSRNQGRAVQVPEVASAIGVSPATLYRIERGDTQGIEFDTLAKLCNYYGVSVGDVLEFERQIALVAA